MKEAFTKDQINNNIPLDFAQRQRACALEDVINDDPYITAAEIICLRDIIATIVDMIRP